MKIRIFYDELKFRIRNITDLKKFVEKVIREEKRVPGDLNFIITTDNELAKINNEFLNREYFTDVITFDYSVRNIVNGEVYISLDMVRRNSKKYEVSVREELCRIIIHGILHLCGYNDETREETDLMRGRENFWLKECFG